ncbi:DedA family protein [Nibricoccus sp. IMCC34717]|uniref:DedA family protein n=1 Tax=Nibricoccus sp. IMCC34717 TaxID=3034021 RepID=UPI0038507991
MHDALHQLITWYQHTLESGGYLLIVLLMAIESSIVPLPSELVIPPAAYLAVSKGNMSVAGVVIAGTIGSWLGAALMYWASRIAGRPLVLRYGKFFLVSPAKVEAAERWAKRFGSFGIFFSRLLPVVRHLIGIPAGIVRLPFGLYSLYTIFGSAVWCSVLAWLGVVAGRDEALMRGELHRITIWVVAAFVVLGAAYFGFVHRHLRNEQPKS